MKILHVNDYREGGGAEVVITRTIELQRERGHEVELFTIDDVPGHKRTWWTYLNNRRARRALVVWLRVFQPDVVHLHNIYHQLSPSILRPLKADCRRRNERVVMTAHDYYLVVPSPGGFEVRDGRLVPVNPVRNWSGLRNVLHIWDAEKGLRSVLRGLQQIRTQRDIKRDHAVDMICCPSGLLCDAVRAQRLPAMMLQSPMPQWAPSSDRPAELTFVFAGRLEREKGLAECLAMWPREFAARLRIVGDGTERDRCEQVIQQRGLALETEFLGQVTHDQAVREIEHAHVLLLPTRCLEVSPLSVHEAMSKGTNLLVPDHGGCAEIVETSGIGFQFTLDDPQSLAASLEEIRTAFDRGDLNLFNARDYLAARRESIYIDRLERIYAGHNLPNDEVPSGSATLHR